MQILSLPILEVLHQRYFHQPTGGSLFIFKQQQKNIIISGGLLDCLEVVKPQASLLFTDGSPDGACATEAHGRINRVRDSDNQADTLMGQLGTTHLLSLVRQSTWILWPRTSNTVCLVLILASHYSALVPQYFDITFPSL